MSIERLIRHRVETLPPDASCAEAARLMRDENVGSVVVSDDDKPLGIVTDRDLVVRVLAEGNDADALTLGDIMSGEPIFLGADRNLEQALATMRDLAIRRLPIVDDEGRLCGMLSMDDVVILLAEQLGDLAMAVRKELGEGHP